MSETSPSTLAIYRRLLSHTQPYRLFLIAALMAMVVEATAGYFFTRLMEPLVNRGFVNPEPRMAVLLPLGIVGLFVLRSLATFCSDYCMARTGRSVVRDLRENLLKKYLYLPSSYFDHEATPVMVSRLNFDTEQVTHASAEALKIIVADTLIIIYMLIVMLQMSVKVTFALVVIAPLIGLIVSYVGKRYRRISRGIQDGMGSMAQAAEQSLLAQQEVKIHGAQHQEISRYASLANRILGLNMKVEVTRATASALVQFLAAFALAAIVWVATREALKGQLNAGQFMALMTSMMAIIPSLRRLTNVQNSISRGVTAAERLFSILDSESEPDSGQRELSRSKGDVEFKNISLIYDSEKNNTHFNNEKNKNIRDSDSKENHNEEIKYALSNISFSAKRGTVTAIVGRSGSGKTSLIQLLPRFYLPNKGQIYLDQYPIEEYKLADLRHQIALVGQKVMLFDDTIAANIAFGSNASEADIKAAAEAANAWEFIARLPQQLNTKIGENGALLSGGQRQRLAIARAILRNAPILVLDEATAALDNESERLVQDALLKLMPDRTTLVIAHRLSTIEHADQVLVLEQGELVEQGTHKELLAKDGVYAHLHRMQFRDGK